MIEINLLEQKKVMKMPTVLGLNLNDFSWKGLLIAFIVYYFPENYLRGIWKAELDVVSQEVVSLNKQLRKFKRDLRKDKDIKDKLDAYNAQVEKLKERSVQVDKIIKTKTNPKKILDRIARSAPESLWLDYLSISPDRRVFIRGAATSYKSIGDFIIAANESPFFGKSLALDKSTTVEEKVDGVKVRLEKFEIKGKVTNYDPFIQ